MYIALRLLRDGAHTTITTRFPNDAVRRFSAMPDSADWLHRLRVVGIDLRDPGQVVALADEVAAAGPARHPDQQRRADRAPLARGLRAPGRGRRRRRCRAGPLPEIVTLGRAATAAARANGHWTPTPQALTALALTAGSASPERIAAGTAIDAGGLVPDLHPHNSWSQVVDEVDPVELLEVQLCNQTAPFILVSRLRAGAGGVAGAPHLRRQRLGDGGPVQPRLQGPGPPAHEHGQGRAEHAHAHQRAGAAAPTAS